MYLAHGNYVKMKGFNTTPGINKEEAKQIFARYKEIPIDEIKGIISELLIKEISISSDKALNSDPMLVYKIYLISGHRNNNEIGYIEAQTGKIVKTVPDMREISATGTFETRYNGTKQAKTQYYNGNYNLCDSSRNAVIHTRALNGSTDIDDAIELIDGNNIWTSVEYASNEDDMGLDIHWALQEIYDYFDDEYNINSFDNNDKSINAYIHYGTLNDYRDQAAWSPTLNAFVFGNGAVKYSPIASLDAVAHEYGHAITDYQIGWEYSGDGVAFHEGMSDIWAIILENRISSNSIWKIGEEISLNDDCIRNIQIPGSGSAETELSDTYLNSTYTSGDYFTKSGILSYCFYLLVNGRIGTNDNDDDYTVYEVGIDDTEELIIEAVFNNFLDNTTTYPQIRTQMISAANSLFGSNSFQSLQVANAWYAVGVGIDPGQVTLSGDKVICNSGTVITANNSPTGSTISWTCSSNLQVYSGGSTSTPTFKPKYSTSGDDGWVQVNYTSNGYTTSGPKKYVGVNQPNYSDVELTLYTTGGIPVSYMCPNTHYHIFLNNNSGCSLSSYDWSIPTGWSTNYTYNNMISINTNSSPGGMVEVEANTCCGVDKRIAVDYFGSGYCSSSYSLSFTPNPTSGETVLTLDVTSEDVNFDINEEWDLEIYNNSQVLKEKKNKIKGKEYKINTLGWKEAVYIIRVKYKDEILIGKLIVKK